MQQKLLIDYTERKVWCFYCQEWIPATRLWIDGTHGETHADGTHAVWDRK